MSKNNSFLFTSILATISLTIVAFIWKYNLILFIALSILATLMLLIERSKQEVKTFAFCAIFGAVSEYVAISYGAWTYGNPNLFSIPIWLPLLWGISSIYIIRVYKNI
jgi:uncharacterized membrane protein YoaT (DUF817 family)